MEFNFHLTFFHWFRLICAAAVCGSICMWFEWIVKIPELCDIEIFTPYSKQILRCVWWCEWMWTFPQKSMPFIFTKIKIINTDQMKWIKCVDSSQIDWIIEREREEKKTFIISFTNSWNAAYQTYQQPWSYFEFRYWYLKYKSTKFDAKWVYCLGNIANYIATLWNYIDHIQLNLPHSFSTLIFGIFRIIKCLQCPNEICVHALDIKQSSYMLNVCI